MLFSDLYVNVVLISPENSYPVKSSLNEALS